MKMEKLEEKTVSQVLRDARLITLAPVKGSKGFKRQYIVGFNLAGDKVRIFAGMVP
jgi:hypothetical protein